MSKSTASGALKPLVFVTSERQELCRLLSSIPYSEWPNGCGPIFNLFFIITDYDDTMIWIHFYITVSFVGICLSYVSSPKTVPMMRCFGVSLNNLLNKQSIVRWFEMSWRPFGVSVIWHCYIYFIDVKAFQLMLLSTTWIVWTRKYL